jgi:hypothetical protein
MLHLDITDRLFRIVSVSALVASCIGFGCAAPDADAQADASLRLVDDAENPDDVYDMIQGWPKESRTVARQMIRKHGAPQGVTRDMIVWNNSGQWLRTVVYRESIRHEFPRPHQDCLQQSIRYEIPTARIDDIVRFSGSIIYDRTAGVLSARCGSEAMNTLAINLVHRIIDDGMSIDRARDEFEEITRAIGKGERPLMTRSLRFAQARSSAGPE